MSGLNTEKPYTGYEKDDFFIDILEDRNSGAITDTQHEEYIIIATFRIPDDKRANNEINLVQFPKAFILPDMIKKRKEILEDEKNEQMVGGEGDDDEKDKGVLKEGGVEFQIGDIVNILSMAQHISPLEQNKPYFILDVEEDKVNCGYVDKTGQINYETVHINIIIHYFTDENTRDDNTLSFYRSTLANCLLDTYTSKIGIIDLDNSNRSSKKINNIHSRIDTVSKIIDKLSDIYPQLKDRVGSFKKIINYYEGDVAEHVISIFDSNDKNEEYKTYEKKYRKGALVIEHKDDIEEILNLVGLKYNEVLVVDGSGAKDDGSGAKLSKRISNKRIQVYEENEEARKKAQAKEEAEKKAEKRLPNGYKNIQLAGVDFIIYNILGIHQMPCSLLNDISYDENNQLVIGRDDLGHLFNMDFNVIDNVIDEVTLSYNMLGFLMLLTELDHDFNDIKQIKSNLDIINQNFINISHELKEQIKKKEQPKNTVFISQNSIETQNENMDTLWNNIYGVIDSYTGNKKKKLSEEEMGRIIAGLLSNDDMPRLVTANGKVNMQMYAPTPLKGSIPTFWSIGENTDKNSEGSQEIVEPISYAENTINLTSDADNKAAYAIPITTNMRPITSTNYPLLKLDAGSSPDLKINNEYYSWFDSLGASNNNIKNIPSIKVLNPLNGSQLISLTYNSAIQKWALLITVDGDDNIEREIKDLNKSSMAELMKSVLDELKEKKFVITNINKSYSMKLFAVSILKSLGDLVCYITVNMQAFLNQYNDNQGNVNEMFLCNSADYSMFYPMVGNLRFTGKNTENINKTFQDTSTYLSCSVKSVQNFFVPLTLKEKNKLFIVKLLFEEEAALKLEIIKDIFLFAEKYKGGLNNKTLIKLLEQANLEFLVINQPATHVSTASSENNTDIFNRTNYKNIKTLFSEITKNKDQHKALILLLEYYFSFMYVSFCLRKDPEASSIYNLIINAPNNILKTLLILNTDIFKDLFIPGFDKLKFNLNQAGLFLEEGAETGDTKEGAETGDTKELFELIKMDEVISTFFDPDSAVVSFAEINFTIEDWKVCCIYAEYILRFKNIEIADVDEEEDEEQKEKEAAKAAEAAEAAKKYEENDNFAPTSVEDVEQDIKIEGITEALKNAIINDIEGQRPTDDKPRSDYGGKRRNKSKKKSKKSKKRQTRKANK